MSFFGSRVILASVKGQFWKSESKSNFKRLSLLKKRESSAMRERGKKREKRKERKEKQEEKV